MKKFLSLLNSITLRDSLLIVGIGLFFFGLYLFMPWVAFAVTGAIIMVAGFFASEKKKGN
jgi:divalent metal cation (Fe/Co/Zn/Cd) transporter